MPSPLRITSRQMFGGILWLSLALSAQPSLAQPAIRWKPTHMLAAPEAIQAAAADERFLYAIANTQVAKYDRRTGKRIAVSIGAAKHLNSGFLWEGRLYCAHSNYPQKPERSDIKVLDPQSLRLDSFKDFGDFGGSLTWAVRDDDHWWCNFAHYGADNARTFLVKFDADWKERRRWTYPREVLDELGSNSLSGGVWRSGSLLVTGHDDPVIFRLRLPKQGTVLEFLADQSAPFTGQGIAHDPKTGGLVGIDRARRQIILATPELAGPLWLMPPKADLPPRRAIER